MIDTVQQVKRYIIPVVGGVVLALALLLVGVQNLFAPVAASGAQTVRVTIPEGASGRDIAAILAKEGLIRNELLFRFLLHWEGTAVRLQAGDYQLSAAMPPREIIKKLVSGEAVMDYIRVTIPEGLHVKQIADILAEKGLVEKEIFLAAVEQGDFPFSFVEQIPPGTDYRLEGYLFPDTYHFRPDADEKNIITQMLQRFEQVAVPVINEGADELGLTIHQAVTLASLVEREARLPEERLLVAAVFLNRLGRNMKLQSCATVQYVLGEPKEHLLLRDLQIPSPYNTYLHNGLPPGPIAAPGVESLRAAVNPADVDYLYFVAKDDGSHVFSRTLQEHNQAKQENRR